MSEEKREKLREQARKISAKFKEKAHGNHSKERESENDKKGVIEEDCASVAKYFDAEEGEIVESTDKMDQSPEMPAESASHLQTDNVLDLAQSNNISAKVKSNRIPKREIINHVTTTETTPTRTISKIDLDSIKPVHVDADEKEKRHKSHKHKKHRHKKFEGERVEGLVKARRYKPPVMDDAEKEKQKVGESQDDYVLNKLFSKSGVIGGIQHDSIIDDGTADYVLVESEAKEKAERAVAAMRASRHHCLTAESGVPNWTGANGGQRKPKFGAKKKGKPGERMSSSELLALMKNRNKLVSSVPQDAPAEMDLFRPDTHPGGDRGAARRDSSGPTDSDTGDLLADIRNFIAFQAATDGEASTGELVAKFQHSLPSQQSPLFKAFLQQICDFRREQDGRGIWSLKEEFQ